MTIYFGDGSSQSAAGVTSGGKVLQVVSTTRTSEYVESIGEGNFGSDMSLNASITPASSSNKVLIMVNTSQGTSSTTRTGFVVYRGGSVIGGYRGESSGNRMRLVTYDVTNDNNAMVSLSGNYLDSPSSTSSQTYSVRIACPSGHWSYLNRQESQNNSSSSPIGASTLTLMEISG